ncbi:MAG TPA: hypothetical protein VNS79_15825 [Sphingobium sp.]|nr:hypothetical protein [Sphingobium sp.]
MTKICSQLKGAMSSALPSPRFGPTYSPAMVRVIAHCMAAISALDARISVSPMMPGWRTRASWSGYTAALQWQGFELDEIDVYSWGCGLKLPGRPLLHTRLDPFGAFAAWQDMLATGPGPDWRATLPPAIGEVVEASDHPALIRALDLVRQWARVDSTAAAWLGAPMILTGLSLTSTPLPCLVVGAKAFRLKRAPDEVDWIRAIKALTGAARAGLDRLDALERHYRRGVHVLTQSYRPGALPELLALVQVRPLLSPQSVANALGLSVAGASKLLERAVAAKLMVEIGQRKSWRRFLPPDLAIRLGLAEPRRGRPPLSPLALPGNHAVVAAVEALDQVMAKINRMLERPS